MRRLAIVIVTTLIATGGAQAAEIKSLISTAMKAPFQEIAAQFEKTTGHKVTATFGPTGPLTRRIADGEAADVVILGGENTATLVSQGKLAAGGPNGYAATFVVNGEADFAMQPIPELMAVPGIEIVGPLPGAFQNVTIYSAGIPTSAKQTDAAKALIEALTAPASAAIYRSKGLEPG
jgi:ABC-type molybdate transport system substrate-binding protein